MLAYEYMHYIPTSNSSNKPAIRDRLYFITCLTAPLKLLSLIRLEQGHKISYSTRFPSINLNGFLKPLTHGRNYENVLQ